MAPWEAILVKLRGILTSAVVWLIFVAHQTGSVTAQTSPPKPNILFVILDDVGIDQLRAFNPASNNLTPVIDTLVRKGVAFNNCWMMPMCSPSRACFFTGRYPLRNGVKSALLDYNLPSSQTSPYEMTTPRVLAGAGYVSAMIGKYHLGGPSNNPAGIAGPTALGWNYFNGCLAGAPPFIDTTLGGQTTNTTLYPCGFPLGPARGVCWFLGPQGNIYCDDKGGVGYTGQECLQAGGIPALTATGVFATNCAAATIPPNFKLGNGYYAWLRTINNGTNVAQVLDRRYMVTAQTDDALDWIRQQASIPGKPWMCTVSYSSIHTPYQQPPTNLYPPGFTWPASIREGNQTGLQIKVLSGLMLYALDQEIGRLLVGAGLATRLPTGEVTSSPEATDTMIIVCGDNGTYYPSVLAPYNPLRAKASPYQTGIAAPMIVSGPMVVQPGRAVTNMVNAVDLFSLFGEIAGIQVRSTVPASHILDCVPTLAYLTNASALPIRRYNYSELGATVPPNVHIPPSVFTVAGQKIGSDILFSSQSLALESGAEWFGPGAAVEYSSCCEVRSHLYTNLTILPRAVWTVRNDQYKLVKSAYADCDSEINPFELFDLTRTPANPVGLDSTRDNLLAGGVLTESQRDALDELMAVMNAILDSEPVCPGDGNLDKVVDQADLQGVLSNWGMPSVFDFDNSGTTDQYDLESALKNFADVCYSTGDTIAALSIQPAGGQLLIQWPTSTPSQHLESSPSLATGSTWTPVAGAPFVIGARDAVFLTQSGQTTFYRLR